VANDRVPAATVEDARVLEAMDRYGGSFVRALAQAAWLADPINLAKLKATFPEYWAEYTRFAAVEPLRPPRRDHP
jgi:hypothetical protein